MILKRVSPEKQQINLLKSFDVSNTISLVLIIIITADINIYRTTRTFNLKFQNNALNGGSGHTNGTYYNIKLFNNNAVPSSAVWDGATADVTVSGGSVTSVNINRRWFCIYKW